MSSVGSFFDQDHDCDNSNSSPKQKLERLNLGLEFLCKVKGNSIDHVFASLSLFFIISIPGPPVVIFCHHFQRVFPHAFSSTNHIASFHRTCKILNLLKSECSLCFVSSQRTPALSALLRMITVLAMIHRAFIAVTHQWHSSLENDTARVQLRLTGKEIWISYILFWLSTTLKDQKAMTRLDSI